MKYVMTAMMCVLLMLCSIGYANNEVISGETITNDFITEDVSPHGSLGGIVSAMNSVIERFVKFGETTVFSDTSGSGDIMDFELYAFENGSDVNMNSLIIGDIIQTSETVDIRGVNASWDTYAATTTIDGADSQPLAKFVGGEQVLYDNGDWISFESFGEPGFLTYYLNGGKNEVPILECDAYCPDAQVVLDHLGASVMDDMKMVAYNGYVGEYIIFATVDGEQGFLGDLNRDGIWEFSSENSGYMVNANAGQSLMLLPAGTYDLYTSF